MEPGSSLPHSQEPANYPYPELHKPSPCSHSFSLRAILILSSPLRLGVPGELLPFPLPHACCMPRTSHSSLLDHRNLVRTINHKDLLFVVFSALYLPRPFLTQISSSAHFLEHSQLMILPLCDQVSYPYKTGRIIILYVLIFIFIANWKTIDSASKTEVLEVEVIHNVGWVAWLLWVINYFRITYLTQYFYR